MAHRFRLLDMVSDQTQGPIWSGCLPERPQCAVPGCAHQAHIVDPFFPYLDDRNRCDRHGPHFESATAQWHISKPRRPCRHGN